LQELRGISLLYAGDFSNALAEFNRAAIKVPLAADPFTIHIRDCHDCDDAVPHTTYTKASFTERMQQLSRAAQGQGDAAAAASFELGNGFYNMSYWGNGRRLYHVERANLEGSRATLNMEFAERYYVRAFDLTANRELKAKALFMAAKTEQNRYYVTRKDESDPQPHSYFRRLRASFSDVQYYQEIIRECGNFRRFLQQ